MTDDYGLALTNNSKTSWAFSMPRKETCVNATNACKKVCYGNGIRYQSDAQKAKRARNFRTVELLLNAGGPELLAQNLVALIDQIRPVDWLAASITGGETKLPWSLRIHDLGDYHKCSYVEAWYLAVLQRPLCSFWLYTRSFRNEALFDALTKLVSLPNCQGWLSVDSDNYDAALLAYTQKPGVWKLAFMQEDPEILDENVLPAVTAAARGKDLVSFPVHRGGHNVEPIQHPALFVCPAVVGVYKLQPNANKLRPCQACAFCLP
jgi:hypothetical protein